MNDYEQTQKILQVIAYVGSKSKKHPIKTEDELVTLAKKLGQEGMMALAQEIIKVLQSNSQDIDGAVAKYEEIMDSMQPSITTAKFGGILNYINKLNTIR